MPVSPLENAEGPVRVVVTSGGTALRDSVALVSVTVRRAMNAVPGATLVFSDGDGGGNGAGGAEGALALSDSADLAPGAAVTVKAGYGNGEATIFSGIVVQHGLRIGGDHDARLVIECRDPAVKMTVGRKNRQYLNQSDADILSALIKDHGLGARVSDAGLQHAELVQHFCTDWDFLLSRAEANGCLVSVLDGQVTVAAPRTSGTAALKVQYGESLIDFEADLDACQQFAQVQARSWDAATQSLVAGAPAGPARLNPQGNLEGAALAAVLDIGPVTLQTGAALPQAALDRWAQAQQLKSALSRLRGRMRFQGSAAAELGGLLELAGVGDRFSGTVLATGLTHRIEQGGWTTEVEFGMPMSGCTARPDVVAPAAAGWVPGIEGLHIGTVLRLDDPAGEHRVQVQLPAAGVDSVWARLLQFSASEGFGACFVPEVGDEVLLGFLSNDPASPVVLGSLYSRRRPPAQPLTADNPVKSIVTRCQARIEFDDANRTITVATPGRNTVRLSDPDRSITLTDPNGNRVRLGPDGITLDSAGDLRIDAQGAISLSALGPVTLSAKADVRVEGLNVTCDAQVGLTAKGSASAELSAAGQTTVKGAMVFIN